MNHETQNAQSAGKTEQSNWTRTVKNYETNKQGSIEFSPYFWTTNSDFYFRIYSAIEIYRLNVIQNCSIRERENAKVVLCLVGFFHLHVSSPIHIRVSIRLTMWKKCVIGNCRFRENNKCWEIFIWIKLFEFLLVTVVQRNQQHPFQTIVFWNACKYCSTASVAWTVKSVPISGKESRKISKYFWKKSNWNCV